MSVSLSVRPSVYVHKNAVTRRLTPRLARPPFAHPPRVRRESRRWRRRLRLPRNEDLLALRDILMSVDLLFSQVHWCRLGRLVWDDLFQFLLESGRGQHVCIVKKATRGCRRQGERGNDNRVAGSRKDMATWEGIGVPDSHTRICSASTLQVGIATAAGCCSPDTASVCGILPGKTC